MYDCHWYQCRHPRRWVMTWTLPVEKEEKHSKNALTPPPSLLLEFLANLKTIVLELVATINWQNWSWPRHCVAEERCGPINLLSCATSIYRTIIPQNPLFFTLGQGGPLTVWEESRMKMDEGGCKLMKVGEGGWRWMKVDEDWCRWMHVDENMCYMHLCFCFLQDL